MSIIVKLDEYDVIGRIEIISNNEIHVFFSYDGEVVEDIIKAVVSEETLEWLPSIAEIAITKYIKEKEVAKKMQQIHKGGIPWE